MKPQPKSNPKPWLAITLIIFFIVLALVVWKILIPMYFPGILPNYAQEVAKPMEEAFKNAGGVKRCMTYDNGRGWDDDEPDYSAIYEIPGSADYAKELLHKIAKDKGFNLTEEQTAQPRDNVTYRDDTKVSSFSDLQDGTIELGMQIYPDKVYAGTGDQFCAVVTPQTPVTDKTTVWIGVNLPAFKR